MIQSLKNKLLALTALAIFALALVPVSAGAAGTTVDIKNSTCAGSDVTITSDPSSDACKDINSNGANTVNSIVSTVLNILSAVVGILAVIMIIFAGFRYVTSGGSDDAVKGAKNTILYAIIGLVVVALAQIIVHFVLDKTAQSSGVPRCVSGKIDSGAHKGDTCK